jgi:hypothetical protein
MRAQTTVRKTFPIQSTSREKSGRRIVTDQEILGEPRA